MSTQTGWWVKHGSVVFVAAQLIVSAVLITLSIVLHGHEPVAGVLSHLAAMFVAALVATVFFSLHDVRETLAGSIATLMLDGNVVTHLSGNARRGLARRIILEDLPSVLLLPDALYNHVDVAQKHTFSTPHLLNYSPTIILSDVPDRPDLVHRDYRCTYSVSAEHLRDGRGTFALRFHHEVSDPTGRLSKEKILTKFEARVGTHVFTIADIHEKVERHRGGLITTALTMEKDIEVVGDVPVTVSYDGVASRLDPTEVMYARYPTRGFRVTLLHREDVVYDVAWFKSWSAVDTGFRAGQQIVRMRNGITAYTDEWLLPGNGVVLYWFSVPMMAVREFEADGSGA